MSTLSKDFVFEDAFSMATDMACAYMSQTPVNPDEVSSVIQKMYRAIMESYRAVEGRSHGPLSPAVPIDESIGADYIVCLEDGKKLKMLKRHLAKAYNMTPDQYRDRWNLPSDYPMVSPNYAERRSAIARETGLGHSGRRKKDTANVDRKVANVPLEETTVPRRRNTLFRGR